MYTHTVPRTLDGLIFSRALELGEIPRIGWPGRGVAGEDVEDTRSHSLRVKRLGHELPRRKGMRLDRLITGQIAMLHDFDELIRGDKLQIGGITLPFAEDPRVVEIAASYNNDSGDWEKKIERAFKWLAFQAAIQDWPLHEQQEATRLYEDYIGAYTLEAKAVRQAHTIANLEQGLDYLGGETRSDRRYRNIDLTTFWADAFEADVWLHSPLDLGPKLGEMADRERELKAA